MPEVAQAAVDRRSTDAMSLARRRAFLGYDPRLENLSRDDDFSPAMKTILDLPHPRAPQNGGFFSSSQASTRAASLAEAKSPAPQ